MVLSSLKILSIVLIFSSCGREKASFDSAKNSPQNDNSPSIDGNSSSNSSANDPISEDADQQVTTVGNDNNTGSTTNNKTDKNVNPNTNTAVKTNLLPGLYAAPLNSISFITLRIKSVEEAEIRISLYSGKYRCNFISQLLSSNTQSAEYNMAPKPNSNKCPKDRCTLKVNIVSDGDLNGELECETPSLNSFKLTNCELNVCS